MISVALASFIILASASDESALRRMAEVAIKPEAERYAELTKRIASAPAGPMKQSGLAGAFGAAKIRVLLPTLQEITLPIPQITGGQTPISFFICGTPADAVTDYRMVRRDDGNAFLRVRLVGKPQEVRIDWSAVVLLHASGVFESDVPDTFRIATPCVQSDSPEIKSLAEKLWPQAGKPAEFAANIQRHIRQMKRVAMPRSLDAIGILKSGMNGICTANANLACALMRSKGIACRSLAVIPPNGMKLEMHRVVEFWVDGRWVRFDPSSLYTDIPAETWRNIVMARTTIRDEQAAMKPRMAVMLGAPHGQEIELLTPGVVLFGQDFFWTKAKPLAEFEATDEVTQIAREMWTAFLKSGISTQWQIEAGAKKDSEAMIETLRRR